MIILKPSFPELCYEVNVAIQQGRQVQGLFVEPDGFGCVLSDDPANRPVIPYGPSSDSPYGSVAPWLNKEPVQDDVLSWIGMDERQRGY